MNIEEILEVRGRAWDTGDSDACAHPQELQIADQILPAAPASKVRPFVTCPSAERARSRTVAVRSDGICHSESLSLNVWRVGGAQVRYIWYRGKRQMIPSTVPSMIGNPLTLPLITGAVLEKATAV